MFNDNDSHSKVWSIITLKYEDQDLRSFISTNCKISVLEYKSIVTTFLPHLRMTNNYNNTDIKFPRHLLFSANSKIVLTDYTAAFRLPVWACRVWECSPRQTRPWCISQCTFLHLQRLLRSERQPSEPSFPCVPGLHWPKIVGWKNVLDVDVFKRLNWLSCLILQVSFVL